MGTILAGTSITLTTGVSVSGRVLALTAAVTLDTNTVSICGAGPANQSPVADAGPDQTAFVATTVTLDGSGSHDADGDGLTFRWTLTSKPAESAAVLSDLAAVSPTFTIDRPGTYIAQLTVNDGTVDSTADTVTISTTNSPPVADAGPDQTVFVGIVVTLDGSRSNDVDIDGLGYRWAFTSRPAGSAATFLNSAIANPTFLVDVAGTYVAQLIVNDGSC